MKTRNFSKKRKVNFYTYIDLESDVLIDDDNNIINIKSRDSNIFQIVDEKSKDNINYWMIRGNKDSETVGWIKNDKLLKFLDVHPQNLNIISKHISTQVNETINIEYEYVENTLYTKSYMLIFNEKLFYGLTFNGKFIGFVNNDAIDFGEIKPIEFNYKRKSVSIYTTPELSVGIPFHNQGNKFICRYILRKKNTVSIGVPFKNRILWSELNETNINITNIEKIYTIDNEEEKVEYYLNCVRANSEEYYKVNEKIGISSKLENILMTQHDNNVISTLYKPISVKVGIICDEFMYHSLKDSANIEYIPYSDSFKVDESFDFVLVVSTWRGIDESWQYLGNPNGEKREKLLEMLNQYNEANIPTVFYSKEDPVNYDRFISIAQNCTYIFTSAEEVINNYKNDTANDNVDYLEFSINPSYHNPIGKDLNNNDFQKQVIFAGSWMKKYPIRNKESIEIFNGVIKSDYDLNIVDRNFDRLLLDYQFPIIYLPYISKTIKHNDLMKLHRATSWGINLNSVKYSNTMFANRVFELQAMGNLVLSNYSMGVNNKFPNIFIVNDELDVKQVLNYTSLKEKKELIAKGITNVMLNNTAYHRMEKIAKKLNFETEITLPKILVVGEGSSSLKSFNNQLYSNKYYITKSEFIESVNKQYDYIAHFSEEVTYEENYLENLLSAFVYTDASVVEMNRNCYQYKTDFDYRKTFSLIKINAKNNKIFNIPETEIFIPVEINKNDKLLSVIIPIHNNGKYLEDKCFRSLKRSSIFNLMEIIMVDDGSTDLSTLKTIDRIRRRNPDIKYYRFDNASGSASRPRNKGIELTSTKYLTFLDPDNEASGDGYKLLIKELEIDDNLDLAIGNVMKEDNNKKSLLNYYYYVMAHNNGDSVVKTPKEFLINSKLRAHSIQALIIKSEIIKENNLKMVEGAAGQDTMFFQELLLHSNQFKAMPELIHMYYAAVTGSVTTTIKRSFFEKYLILEKERVPFLKKHGLFEDYVNERFPYYFKNWYLKRLSLVSEDEKEYVKSILFEILSMYINDYKESDLQFIETLKEHFDMSFFEK